MFPLREHPTDGIRLGGDLADRLRHASDALLAERKPVDERGELPPGVGIGDIERIGGKDGGLAREDGLGHRLQGGILGWSRDERQSTRGGTRGRTQLAHDADYIGARPFPGSHRA